jgi:hypothetical protein
MKYVVYGVTDDPSGAKPFIRIDFYEPMKVEDISIIRDCLEAVMDFVTDSGEYDRSGLDNAINTARKALTKCQTNN